MREKLKRLKREKRAPRLVPAITDDPSNASLRLSNILVMNNRHKLDLDMARETAKTPENIDKTLGAIRAAWMEAPHVPLGKILSWIAAEDPYRRGAGLSDVDTYQQTGIFRLWKVNDNELRILANKWRKKQQARPRKKKPIAKFPRIKSI